MNYPFFSGVCTALVTPFLKDSINYPMLEQLLRRQYDAGIRAVVICGTTGESATLTDEEKLTMFRYAKKSIPEDLRIIAGTGSNSTVHAIALSQAAQDAGADALLVVSPYYNKATQKGLIAHFTAIANSISIPVVLYNVPSRTGCNILPETAVALAKNVENIVAIKEACGNISQIAKLAALADGCIDIYSGNDDQVVPILSLGGKGVISVLSNVAPQETHDMCQKFFDGDVVGSREIQLKAMDLIDALFCEVNPIPVKAAMNLMGWNVGGLRAPLTVMEEAN